MPYDLWSYRRQVIALSELSTLSGYQVKATDGPLGTVGHVADELGGSYVTVRVGLWILARTVLVPAGTIARIDHVERTVYVDRDKEEILAAPRFDDRRGWDPTYQAELSAYYGRAGM